MIFSYINLSELFRCHLVSRQWRYFALSNPSRYASVDLTSSGNPITLEQVQSIVLNAGGRIQNLKMELPEITFSRSWFELFHSDGSNPPGPKFDGAHHILPLFRSLEKLTLHYYHPSVSIEFLFGIPWLHMTFLRVLILRGYFCATDIARICEAASHIERLDCECTLEEDDKYHMWIEPSRSVKMLIVKTGCRFRDAVSSDLNRLLKWFPNVQYFMYENSSRKISSITLYWETLELFKVRAGYFIKEIDIRSAKLRSLVLRNVDHLERLKIRTYCNLEELRMYSIPKLQDSLLPTINECSTSLKWLSLVNASLKIQCIESIIRVTVNLVYLDVSNTDGFNDLSLEIVYTLIYLERFLINRCFAVTENGIMGLVQSLCQTNGGRLFEITAQYVPTITSEIVVKARQLGVLILI
jgi:hypothetical protein